MKEVVRKVRSDKKKDIKPIVPIEIYNLICDFSYITNLPIKDICEYFCMEGFKTEEVINHISSYFKQDYIYSNTLYHGDPSLTHSRYIKVNGNKMRLSIRFSKDFYNCLHQLAYCMNLTPASSCKLILESSLLNITIVNRFLKKYIPSNIDENRKKILRYDLKYIKKNNLYHDNDSLTNVIKIVFDEVKKRL